ncbi:MAG: hypothetical protein KGN84_07625 [Acidobacteriota bacterium]|nr:hypothetical protein [Acidobacteriota bacterium]
MLDIAALRAREEQKVIAALHSLNAARKGLQDAIGAAEAQEQEFRRISDEARHRLEALDLVEQMTREGEQKSIEGGPQEPTTREESSEALSRLIVATGSPAMERVTRVSRATEHPLFPSPRRNVTELSILP